MSKPYHATPAFPVENDQLKIAGKNIRELLQVAGDTPFYVYDRTMIHQRIRELRDVLPSSIHLHYAVKANPMAELVQDIATRVDGLDVASEGELNLGLGSGMDPRRISFAGPGKGNQELQLAVAHDVLINVESENELLRVSHIGGQLKKTPRVALRINPDFELKSAGMKMGGRSTPFGIDREQAPRLLRKLDELPVEFVGLHVFAGSQNLNPRSLMDAQRATFELGLALQADMPEPMQVFNIGGGLGIPYFPGESRLELEPIANHLSSLVDEYSPRLGNPEIILELGRYLVGESGAYICRVIDRKVSRNKTWLITDGGMHHHLAASGNLGQVLRKNYPVVNPERVFDAPRETVSIAGPLCTPLDLIADNVEIGETGPGEYIAVLQSGAYGYSASPTGFLSRPGATQLLL